LSRKRVPGIYNDGEVNIGSDDSRVNGKKYGARGLVLAVAVLSSDGTIVSRKKLADKQGHLTCFTADQQSLPGGGYLIPLGQDKLSLIRNLAEYEQWGTVSVR
jgi:hypothetical protein